MKSEKKVLGLFVEPQVLDILLCRYGSGVLEYIYISVAQLVKHCVSNSKQGCQDHGFHAELG